MKIKILRVVLCIVLAVSCFLLQSGFTRLLPLLTAAPNLLLIVTFSVGFIKGRMWGMFTGLGCGLLLFIFRFCKKTPAEWCSFAILLMNVVSPLIERVTGRKSFGEVKKNG